MVEKKQQLQFNFPRNLTFKTIPSSCAWDVSVPLPVGTTWRVVPRKDGIYLEQYDRMNESPPKHKISCYSSVNGGHIDIKSREGSFIILSSTAADLFYLSYQGGEYLSIGSARQFMRGEQPRFLYGGLEFTIII